jgi:hypothetical protein
VTAQVVPCPAVPGGGSWVGKGGDLDIPERSPGVQGSGDEAVPEGVREDVLADAGSRGWPDDECAAVAYLVRVAPEHRGQEGRSG